MSPFNGPCLCPQQLYLVRREGPCLGCPGDEGGSLSCVSPLNGPCRCPQQLHLVTREPAPGERQPSATDQLLLRLTEQFVNCCCFQMWASFIQ